jgi:large subunit ribosomal protein L10
MAEDYVIEPAKAKIGLVSDLRELVSQSNAAILADYRGLSVAELSELRKKLRAVDAELHVVKNTLFKRAAEGLLPVSEFVSHLEGPTAIGFAKGDPIVATKILVDYAKDHKAFNIKVGVVDGKVYEVAQVEALSKIPSKEILISQMLGSLNAPITGLVGTLNGVISNFVFTLQAVVDQKTAPAEAV